MIPFDIAVIGIVFAFVLLIIFFSAIVLYLAFRIKETFRKETRRGATAAKIAFLISIVFLAGGIFYFFANTLATIREPTVTPTPTPTPSSSISPTPTFSPSPTASPSPSSTSTASPSQTPTLTPIPTSMPQPLLSISLSYPSQIKIGAKITISFIITNPSELTAHAAVIQTNSLFEYFTVDTSTHTIVGNVIEMGDISPGTTISSLQLTAQDKPTQFSTTITVTYQEMTEPTTDQISIAIRGGP